MPARNTATRYGWLAQWLHWLIAALIVSQYVLAQLAESAADASRLRQLALLANHKSIGITVLALAVVRLGWRFASRPPPLPAVMPRWQVVASHTSHTLLYALLFLLPLSGWLMSSATAYSVSWFNLIQLPDLVRADPALADTLKAVHHTLADALFVVALVHLLAALKHHVLDRDDVLRRMVSAGSFAAFVVTLGGAVWASSTLLAPVAGIPGTVAAKPNVAGQAALEPAPAARPADAPAGPSAAPPDAAPDAAPDLWAIDYAASHIAFTAEQAGATFTGRWPSWRADIRFAPEALEASGASVTVKVAEVATGDRERDETIVSREWFDSANHPAATFRATGFEAAGDGSFTARATLEMKGVSQPVLFEFTVAERDGRRVLDGKVRLDRLAWNLGTGDWADPTWVGRFVSVTAHVEAEPGG